MNQHGAHVLATARRAEFAAAAAASRLAAATRGRSADQWSTVVSRGIPAPRPATA